MVTTAWQHLINAGNAGVKLTGKFCPSLGNVFVPPGAIHGVENIRPWAQRKGGVGYYYCSVCALLSPRFDRLAVLLGEAWPAGDADDCVPVGGVGFALVSGTG